jgi:hypothetical protein
MSDRSGTRLSRDSRVVILSVIADRYAAAGDCWPCWQWISHELWTRSGLDVEQTLGGLPPRKHDYRPSGLYLSPLVSVLIP